MVFFFEVLIKYLKFAATLEENYNYRWGLQAFVDP